MHILPVGLCFLCLLGSAFANSCPAGNDSCILGTSLLQVSHHSARVIKQNVTGEEQAEQTEEELQQLTVKDESEDSAAVGGCKEMVANIYETTLCRKADGGANRWINECEKGKKRGAIIWMLTNWGATANEYRKCRKCKNGCKEPSGPVQKDACTKLVEDIYKTTLCREADGGANRWIGECKKGKKKGAIIWMITNWGPTSKEYAKCDKCKNGCKEMSAELKAKHVNCNAMVDRMYETTLCRKPDKNGKASWMTRCLAGESEGNLTWKMTLSNEYKKCEKCQNSCQELTDEQKKCQAMAQRMFEEVLCRKPDMNGKKHWIQRCMTEEPEGDLRWKMTLSHEYKKCDKCQNGCQELSEKQKKCKAMAERLYEDILCRKADFNGRAHWMERCMSGEPEGDLRWKMSLSDEYKKCEKCQFNCKELSKEQKQCKAMAGRLYETVLCRKPDMNGERHWMERCLKGESEGDLKWKMSLSTEYQKCAKCQNGCKELSEKEKACSAMATRLYETVLCRAPDINGKRHWMDRCLKGEDEGTLVWIMQMSDEYKKCERCQNSCKPLSEQDKRCKAIVKDMYKKVLCRKPDPNGFKHWMGRCQSGESEGDLRWKMTLSDEYRKCDKCRNDCKEPSDKDKACSAMADEIYQTVLCREPDAKGKQHWVDRCKGGEDKGTLVWKMQMSDEYKKCEKCQNDCKPLSDEDKACKDTVDHIYKNILCRKPDINGAKHWMERCQSGEDQPQLEWKMSLSDEYKRCDKCQNGCQELSDEDQRCKDMARRLYQDVLCREPEFNGADFWKGRCLKGEDEGELAWKMRMSEEYKNCPKCQHNCMDVPIGKVSDSAADKECTDMVTRVYTSILCHKPDSRLAHWVGKCKGGMRESSMEVEFFMSDEYAKCKECQKGCWSEGYAR